MLILKAMYVEKTESRPHVLPTCIEGRTYVLEMGLESTVVV